MKISSPSENSFLNTYVLQRETFLKELIEQKKKALLKSPEGALRISKHKIINTPCCSAQLRAPQQPARRDWPPEKRSKGECPNEDPRSAQTGLDHHPC